MYLLFCFCKNAQWWKGPGEEYPHGKRKTYLLQPVGCQAHQQSQRTNLCTHIPKHTHPKEGCTSITFNPKHTPHAFTGCPSWDHQSLQETLMPLMGILPMTTSTPHLRGHSWPHMVFGSFPSEEGLASGGNSVNGVANSAGSAKARAPKLFSAMTASPVLVRSLPRQGFWRGGILTWMYKCWHISFNVWVKNWKNRLALSPSE